MADVLYSDCLITLMCHPMNWKSYERNLPYFPQVRHNNSFLVDYVNELYESILGFPKYVNW